MRPNFFHSASSSISWQQQQQQQELREKGVLAPFPYNHQQQQGTGGNDLGTSFHRGGGVSQLMNMESSSPSSTHLNYSTEGDEINVEHVVLGRALVDSSEQMAASTTTTTPLMEKEHMFDKVVTPSDVGKLNRLVIPKQYAEKYFPLDSSSNEKGLLLNFEDRNGKPWRFRYSYWNSSQSYVMTKGWSRFVKDKKLDAGDVVSFLRGVGELGKDRLFIDWRRRPTAPPFPPPSHLPSGHHYFSFHPYFCRDHHSPNTINPPHQYSTSYTSYGGLMNGNPFPSPLIYYRSPISQMAPAGTSGAAAIDEEHDPMVFESVPVVQGKAAAKRLRLFGVNMDCPITETSEPEIILSSTAVHHDHHPSMLANPPPSASNSGNFYSPSSSSSSTIKGAAYPNFGAQVQRKMFPDKKGKGSLSLDFDV